MVRITPRGSIVTPEPEVVRVLVPIVAEQIMLTSAERTSVLTSEYSLGTDSAMLVIALIASERVMGLGAEGVAVGVVDEEVALAILILVGSAAFFVVVEVVVARAVAVVVAGAIAAVGTGRETWRNISAGGGECGSKSGFFGTSSSGASKKPSRMRRRVMPRTCTSSSFI